MKHVPASKSMHALGKTAMAAQVNGRIAEDTTGRCTQRQDADVEWCP